MSNKGKSAGIIIIILTFLVFCGFIAMMIAPREKVAESGDLKMIHTEETDATVDQDFLVMVRVIYPGDIDSLKVKLRYYRESEFHILSMENLSGTEYYGVMVPGYSIGQRTYYYLEADDASGQRVVLPEGATDDFRTEYDYFKIRFEGKASFILLLLHIVLMIAAIFYLIHALYYAMYFLQTDEKSLHMVRSVNTGILAFFITGFPIGWIIEKQVIGNYWEGIPFGWDITDSKTLIILLLWVVFILLQRRGVITLKGYARWVIINTIITILLFLLPHSL